MFCVFLVVTLAAMPCAVSRMYYRLLFAATFESDMHLLNLVDVHWYGDHPHAFYF